MKTSRLFCAARWVVFLFTAILTSRSHAALLPAASGFRGGLTNRHELVGSSNQVLKFNQQFLNTSALSVAGNGTFTVNESGIYTLGGRMDFQATGGSNYAYGRTIINGSTVDFSIGGVANNFGWSQLDFGGSYQLNAGDQVHFEAGVSGGSFSAVDNHPWSAMSIIGSKVINGQATSGALRGSLTNRTEVVGASSAILKFNALHLNSGEFVSNADGTITVLESGLYTLGGRVDFIASPGSQYASGVTLINGTQVDRSLGHIAGNGGWSQLDYGGTYQLNAGDTIGFRAEVAGGVFTAMDNAPFSAMSVLHHRNVGGQASATAYRGSLTNRSELIGQSLGTLKFLQQHLNTAGLSINGNGDVQVHQTGLYSLGGRIDFISASATFGFGRTLINGSLVDLSMGAIGRNNSWSQIDFGGTYHLNQGDILRFEAGLSGGTFLGIDNAPWSAMNIVQHHTINSAATVPEPSSFTIMGVALLGFAGLRWVRRRKRSR